VATTVVADTQLQTGQRLAIGFTEVAKPGQVNAEEAFKAGLIYVPTVLICYTSSTASISPYRINRESHDGNLKVGVRLRAALPMMVIFIGEPASWKARRGFRSAGVPSRPTGAFRRPC
jgi:hypothetical protein